MGNKLTAKQKRKPHSLDDVAWVEGQRNSGLNLRDIVHESRIAERIGHLSGRRANISLIWRIENEGRVASDVAGLTESAIYAFFGTDSWVAYEAQLAEHLLRNAGPQGLAGTIAHCKTVLAELALVDEQKLEAVDRLALASLAAQIALYQARGMHATAQLRDFYRFALNILMPHQAEIDRLAAGDLVAADPGLGVLVVRMMLNALFAAYQIDALDKNSVWPITRVTAGKFLTADFARVTEKATFKFGDPRLAFFAAEGASFLGKKFVAARLIRASMKVDACDDFASWQPSWLPRKPIDEPHLGDVIPLLS